MIKKDWGNFGKFSAVTVGLALQMNPYNRQRLNFETRTQA